MTLIIEACFTVGECSEVGISPLSSPLCFLFGWPDNDSCNAEDWRVQRDANHLPEFEITQR